MHFTNNDVYEGEWRNGVKDGNGKYVYYNGDKYTGHWREDKKHG